jgi:hypothetical protein
MTSLADIGLVICAAAAASHIRPVGSAICLRSPPGTSAAIPGSAHARNERQMKIMKTISKAGLKVNAGIKAGGVWPQHNRTTLKVRAGIKAGGVWPQHNRATLKVRTGLKAGTNFVRNHSRRALVA